MAAFGGKSAPLSSARLAARGFPAAQATARALHPTAGVTPAGNNPSSHHSTPGPPRYNADPRPAAPATWSTHKQDGGAGGWRTRLHGSSQSGTSAGAAWPGGGGRGGGGAAAAGGARGGGEEVGGGAAVATTPHTPGGTAAGNRAHSTLPQPHHPGTAATTRTDTVTDTIHAAIRHHTSNHGNFTITNASHGNNNNNNNNSNNHTNTPNSSLLFSHSSSSASTSNFTTSLNVSVQSPWTTLNSTMPVVNASSLPGPTPFPGYVSPDNLTFDVSAPYTTDNDTGCVDWNGSFCFSSLNFTNVTTTEETGGIDPNFWVLLLLVFPLLTVFGNSLVCLSVYRERSLRTVTNYFIVSLAISDIMVAVLVMPLAVYVEVTGGRWYLGDELCDTWVAMDVMCCTASILNLTAISVDRFIAVTQPIKYAKHKNSKRVYVMLALTWIISIAISSPIALGMNYTERRQDTPHLCFFYNSDFLIYSSMGSFYIPCVIMILLYWRIFRAIRLRARKAALQKKKQTAERAAARNVIENAGAQASVSGRMALNATTAATTTSEASATEDCHKELLPAGNSAHLALMKTRIAEETSFTNYNAKMSTTGEDTADEESHSHSHSQHSQSQIEAVRSPISDEDGAHVIPNQKSIEALSPASDDGHVSSGNQGYRAPSHVEIMTSPTSPSGTLLSPPPPRKALGIGIISKNNSGKHKKNNNKEASPKKHVTKFNFHLSRHHSKKKKASSTNKRERKATKTLAIVLGVFLLCWVPFFTVNIMTAICIRFDLFSDVPECNIEPILISFFVWLGYINSFLNPVIYTIFNIEFRKAFNKILVEGYKKCGRR